MTSTVAPTVGQGVPPAEELSPADLWLNSRGYSCRIAPSGRCLRVAVSFSGQPGEVIEPWLAVPQQKPHKLRMVVDDDNKQLGVEWNKGLIVPWEHPLRSCSCPDGGRWHGARKHAGLDPKPVMKSYMSANGDIHNFEIDPLCNFCRPVEGIYHQPFQVFDWPWRHTANAGLTMIYVPPSYAKIKYSEHSEGVRMLQVSPYNYVDEGYEKCLDAALTGKRGFFEAEGNRALGKKALRQLRERQSGVKNDIFTYKLKKGKAPVLSTEASGLQVATAGMECGIWFPDLLTNKGCEHVPFVPYAKTRTGQETYWEVTGHFAIHELYFEAWKPYLEPLGVTFDSN